MSIQKGEHEMSENDLADRLRHILAEALRCPAGADDGVLEELLSRAMDAIRAWDSGKGLPTWKPLPGEPQY